MDKFKLIVAGTRTFKDYSILSLHLDRFLRNKSKDHEIVFLCGKAKGADELGEKYALIHGYKIEEYYPDWNKFGPAAGPKRNAEMAKNAHACVVFWDGISRGTKSMIEEAKKNNLSLRIVKY